MAQSQQGAQLLSVLQACLNSEAGGRAASRDKDMFSHFSDFSEEDQRRYALTLKESIWLSDWLKNEPRQQIGQYQAQMEALMKCLPQNSDCFLKISAILSGTSGTAALPLYRAQRSGGAEPESKDQSFNRPTFGSGK